MVCVVCCSVTLRLFSVSKEVWPAAQFASPLASSSSFSLAVLGTSLAAARQATVQRRGGKRYSDDVQSVQYSKQQRKLRLAAAKLVGIPHCVVLHPIKHLSIAAQQLLQAPTRLLRSSITRIEHKKLASTSYSAAISADTSLLLPPPQFLLLRLLLLLPPPLLVHQPCIPHCTPLLPD